MTEIVHLISANKTLVMFKKKKNFSTTVSKAEPHFMIVNEAFVVFLAKSKLGTGALRYH